MAMKSNKNSIMAAIAAAGAPSEKKSPQIIERTHHTLPKGVTGNIRANIGGVQDVDPNDILPWGPKDRMDVELTPVNSGDEVEVIAEVSDLAESIEANGQQVPVLLRPSGTKDGKFEVIYGRRRILACRMKSIPVKSLIRSMEDREALLAKGLENASREGLSFYERARFAKQMMAEDYDRKTVCEALAISKNVLSQLERITKSVPDALGDIIGPAPASGRPKWNALADALQDKKITSAAAEKIASSLQGQASDKRLTAILGSFNTSESAFEAHPAPGVTIKTGKSTINMSVKRAGKDKEFAEWLEKNLGQFIQSSYAQFRKSKSDEDGS